MGGLPFISAKWMQSDLTATRSDSFIKGFDEWERKTVMAYILMGLVQENFPRPHFMALCGHKPSLGIAHAQKKTAHGCFFNGEVSVLL